MKKILYLAATLFFAVSCSGGGDGSEKKNNETDSSVDSAKLAEEAKVSKESILDSMSLEEIAGPMKDSYWRGTRDDADYVGLLADYETAVKQYEKYIKNAKGDYSKQATYTKKCNKLYKQLEKGKKSMDSDQKKKLNSLKAEYDKAYNSIQG